MVAWGVVMSPSRFPWVPTVLLATSSRPLEWLMRVVVWAGVGSVFGALFLILYHYLGSWLPPVLAAFLACIGAGGMGALIYGSMRLSVIVALYANLAAIVYFVVVPRAPGVTMMLLVSGLTGAVIGALYGARVHDSRVCRAEAKALAGMLAGAVGSTAVVVPTALGLPLPLFWIGLLVCPATGLAYLSIARWFVERCSGVLRPTWDGLLVGLATGSSSGMVFWVIVGSLDGYLTSTDQAFVGTLFEGAGQVMLGSVLGATAVATIRSLLRRDWLDL